jgi:hypothetical protein
LMYDLVKVSNSIMVYPVSLPVERRVRVPTHYLFVS